MTPKPTGRLVATDTGVDLVLTRTFTGSADDVWASITDSARTARWFGPWTGEARPGSTIRVQMRFEEGEPWMPMRIERCEPPRLLELRATDEAGDWHLELRVEPDGPRSRLVLVHHRPSIDGVGEIGPGWEYYLDNLVAATADRALPSFADYYPGQQEGYERLAKAAGDVG